MLSNRIIYFLTLILAACSLGYSLLLANALSIIFNDYIFYQTISTGIYILGMGSGCYLSDFLKKERLSLEFVELGMVILSFFSLTIIYSISTYMTFDNYRLYMIYENSGSVITSYVKYIIPIMSEVIVFFIGFLSGFELPILMRLIKKTENTILGFNYFGTIIGTVIFCFILNVYFSHSETAIIFSFINLLCLITISDSSFRKSLYAAMFLILFFTHYIFFKDTETNFYKVKYTLSSDNVFEQISYSNLLKIAKKNELKTFSSKYQKVDIFKSKGTNFSLFLNSDFQIGQETSDSYHQSFSYIPIFLNQKIPENVLIIGGGDGLLVKELLKIDKINSITLVEIDDAIIELAKTDSVLVKMNGDAFNSNRVHLIVGDGFDYARKSNQKYDAIFLDLPIPTTIDLSKLYSQEFYTFLKRLLKNNDSFIAMDAPIFDSSITKDKKQEDIKKINNIILSTLHFSGFKSIHPFFDAYGLPFLYIKESEIQSIKKISEDSISGNINKELVENIVKRNNELSIQYSIDKKFINSVFKPQKMPTINPF